MAPKDLKGKTVIVTGASKGIGFSTAKAFAAHGANEVMLARGKERLMAAAAEIGAGANPIVCDISNPDDVRAAFAEIDKKFGRVDVLANVCGMAILRKIDELSDQDILDSFATNLFGMIYTTREAIPRMKAVGSGDIINFSSESTLFPYPFLGMYATSKAAVEMFSLCSTKELRQHGIRVTSLICGATATEFATSWDPNEALRFITEAAASGELAQSGADKQQDPDDVADVVVYIATRPEGQILNVVHSRAYGVGDTSKSVEQHRLAAEQHS